MWISYHVFLWDINNYDYFLNVLNSEFYNSGIKNYFFIRYWLGGPHIRVRVKGTPRINEALVLNILDKTVKKVFKLNKKMINVKLDKNKYYNAAFTDGKEIDPQKYPWYKNGDVIQIKYTPEFDRYGGVELIGKSEEAFVYSTELVMSLLKTKPSFSKKIYLIFSIFNDLVNNILGPSDRIFFYRNSKKFWEDSGIESLKIQSFNYKKFWIYIEKLSNNLRKLNSYENFLDKLKEIYHSTKINKKYKRAIIFSQFHMTANRMGVPIAYELLFYNIEFNKEKLDD